MLQGVGFTNEWSYTKETCEWETDVKMYERNGPKIRPIYYYRRLIIRIVSQQRHKRSLEGLKYVFSKKYLK